MDLDPVDLSLWHKCLLELKMQLQPGVFAWLDGSELVEAGSKAGSAYYRVELADPRGLLWLDSQATILIAKTLGSLLRQPRPFVEICAPQEAAP